MPGSYVKHSNNAGWVGREEQSCSGAAAIEQALLRATPQAFSHFSYVASGGEVLICDIQGVGDLFTDPQIHTPDGNSYGEGICSSQMLLSSGVPHKVEVGQHPSGATRPQPARNRVCTIDPV